jgi:stress-induced morphogen
MYLSKKHVHAKVWNLVGKTRARVRLGSDHYDVVAVKHKFAATTILRHVNVHRLLRNVPRSIYAA